MCDVRVRIKGGMKEFVGKVGTIVGREDAGMHMYRVELDEAVLVNGDMVKDDLWSGPYLEILEFEPDPEEEDDFEEVE